MHANNLIYPESEAPNLAFPANRTMEGGREKTDVPLKARVEQMINIL